MGEAAHDAVIRRIAFQRPQGRLQLAACAMLVLAEQIQDLLGPDVLFPPQKAGIDLRPALVGEKKIGGEHEGSTENTKDTEKGGSTEDTENTEKDGKIIESEE